MILIFASKQQGADYLRALETMQETLARMNALSKSRRTRVVEVAPEFVDYITAVSSLVRVLAEAKVQLLNG